MSDTKTQPGPSVEDQSTDRDTETLDVSDQQVEGDKEKAEPPKAWGSDAPDGGVAAWLVVVGVWCTSFCSFGWLNSVGTFQEYYQEHLLSSYSASTVSWIPSLQIFFMMALGPFVGLFYDSYGPRLLLLVGTFLHVFGIMMASISTQYYQILLAQGVCSAIGAACLFQPSVACAAGWFNKKRGAALGIAFTGSSLGGVIFPILISQLISKIGFPWAMRTGGFLILALLIVANLTIKPLHRPKATRVTVAQLVSPLRETDFLLITAGFFCFSYGFYVPIDYIQVQAISAGMSSNLAQYLLSFLNAGSLFGRLFAGFLGDRLGRFNIYIVVCYFSGLWILALWLPASGNAAIIAFAVLFGFFSGAYVSLITPLVLAISPFTEVGFRTGMVMLFCAFAGLTTNPINGAIVAGPGGWQGLKIWSGVFCVVGSTFVLLARVRRTGWKLAARF